MPKGGRDQMLNPEDETPAQILTLAPVMDAAAAALACETLLAKLHSGTALRVDASQVGRISTPGVQFLVAARAQALALGGAMTMIASPALHRALDVLGLNAMFQPHIEEGP